MRLLLLSVLLSTALFGVNSNPLLLRAQASIFPKLILLAKEPKAFHVGGTIVFAIIHETSDTITANKLKALMQQQYGGVIEGFPFKVTLIQYSKLDETVQASAIMALHSDRHIGEPVELAIKKNIISFVGDAADLYKGYLFALNLERSTVIYMNKPMLPAYRIEFTDTLYQVVRFFDEN
jgi:hypothetical protein